MYRTDVKHISACHTTLFHSLTHPFFPLACSLYCCHMVDLSPHFHSATIFTFLLSEWEWEWEWRWWWQEIPMLNMYNRHSKLCFPSYKTTIIPRKKNEQQHYFLHPLWSPILPRKNSILTFEMSSFVYARRQCHMAIQFVCARGRVCAVVYVYLGVVRLNKKINTS